VHGLSCVVCRFNFEAVYGVWGKGFIHVHHNKPISESGPTSINPQTDLSVVCPNCHAMIHRDKNHTLSVQELREKMEGLPRLETVD
jgi:5-methylcytosine-specific restriction enzyme A